MAYDLTHKNADVPPIEIGQTIYLNNIVEQDRRAIKQMTKLRLRIDTVWSALFTIAGIEIMDIRRWSQLRLRHDATSLHNNTIHCFLDHLI